MSDHAKFSPSGASRWMTCPGSVGMEEGFPNSDNDFSAHGTAAHSLLESVLQARIAGDFSQLGDPRNYLDKKIEVGSRAFYVDEEMIEHVGRAADDAFIFSNAKGVLRESEQRVYFGDAIGAPDDQAFGTCDFSAVDAAGGEILTMDFKYGMGVQVYAESNEQMMLYALGLLNKYEMIGDFTKVRMIVHQPRLDHVDEWSCSVDDLLVFAEHVKAAVKIIEGDFDRAAGPPQSMTGPLNPSDKSCRFCRAKATCPALRAEINQAVAVTASVDDFADLTEIPSLAAVPADQLGAAMDKVGLLEDLAKAIRAETERRLLAGEPVDSPQGGYKIVQGKRGNRAWSSDEDVIAALKTMRLKNEDIYTFKLKGPAPIEKLLAKENPRRWAKLAKFIGQSDGKPSVAPMSDGRPALTMGAALDDFSDLTGAEDLV